MVSLDIYLNETTRHADLILPSTVQMEHENYDLLFETTSVRNFARWSPDRLRARGRPARPLAHHRRARRAHRRRALGSRRRHDDQGVARDAVGPEHALPERLARGRLREARGPPRSDAHDRSADSRRTLRRPVRRELDRHELEASARRRTRHRSRTPRGQPPPGGDADPAHPARPGLRRRRPRAPRAAASRTAVATIGSCSSAAARSGT